MPSSLLKRGNTFEEGVPEIGPAGETSAFEIGTVPKLDAIKGRFGTLEIGFNKRTCPCEVAAGKIGPLHKRGPFEIGLPEGTAVLQIQDGFEAGFRHG